MHIIFTGPESTGKTTLASWLAQELQLPLVNEMARPYLDMRKEMNPDYTYSYHDLHEIAMLQRYEAHQILLNHKNAISDTDLMTIIIWGKEVFGKFDDQWMSWWLTDIPDITFLCVPDIPWEHDPLRENPIDRDRLYEIYKAYLDENNRSYISIEGSLEQRQDIIRYTLQSMGGK